MHCHNVKPCFTIISLLLFLRVAFPPSPGSGGPSGHHDDQGQSGLPGHSGSYQGQPGSYLQGQSGPSSISSRTKDVLTRSCLNLYLTIKILSLILLLVYQTKSLFCLFQHCAIVVASFFLLNYHWESLDRNHSGWLDHSSVPKTQSSLVLGDLHIVTPKITQNWVQSKWVGSQKIWSEYFVKGHSTRLNSSHES